MTPSRIGTQRGSILSDYAIRLAGLALTKSNFAADGLNRVCPAVLIFPKPVRRINSFLASEHRHHAAKAVLLRWRPPPLIHQSGYAANVTKPQAERQARYGRPLRDDSELVKITIRFRWAILYWRPIWRYALR